MIVSVSNYLYLHYPSSERKFFHLIYDSTKTSFGEYLRYLVILDDKLSVKEINIKKLLLLKKKIEKNLQHKRGSENNSATSKYFEGFSRYTFRRCLHIVWL